MSLQEQASEAAEADKSSTMQSPKASRDGLTTMSKQLIASVFFGVSSISIITVNKAVLTTFQCVVPFSAHQNYVPVPCLIVSSTLRFPSFQVVGLGQVRPLLSFSLEAFLSLSLSPSSSSTSLPPPPPPPPSTAHQMVAILTICWTCRMAKVVDFPPPSVAQIKKVCFYSIPPIAPFPFQTVQFQTTFDLSALNV